MHTVGITDFNMKDITKPATERLRKILSAVINFAKFREEQLSEFEKFTSETVKETQQNLSFVYLLLNIISFNVGATH